MSEPHDPRSRELDIERAAWSERLRAEPRVMPRDVLREALRETANALALTYTTVREGERPHWCDWTKRHEPTCAGMLHVQDMARAALAAVPSESDAGLDALRTALRMAVNALPSDRGDATWSTVARSGVLDAIEDVFGPALPVQPADPR